MADSSATQQLFDIWKKQIEESSSSWAKLMSQAPSVGPSDATSFWRPVLDQGLQQWARVAAQSPVTPDLIGQWKQFLDQWIESWSKAFSQAMSTNAFAEAMGRTLDQWLTAQGPVKKAAEQSVEQTLQAWNLPSRTQLAGVAKQIVELEDRIDRLEDGIAAVLRRLEEAARPTGEKPGRERGGVKSEVK